jgi:hypothetical protein
MLRAPPRRRSATLSLLLAMAAAAALGSCGGESTSVDSAELSCDVKPSQTFRDRVEPLLREDDVSTCNQCHLSGVDLNAFVRSTPCKTMACLVEQDLVDLDEPEQSRILGWIERAKPDSALITDDVIQQEYQGFLEWIVASAACPQACAGVACGNPSSGPLCPTTGHDAESEEPPEAIDGCSDEDLEHAFYRDVYAWRGRCFPCHYDTEVDADPAAPRWLSAKGNCETGSVTTLRNVLRRGYLDLDEPDSSLLLLKPLSNPDVYGVEHSGGPKFEDEQDPAYASFQRFIEHYAACAAAPAD